MLKKLIIFFIFINTLISFDFIKADELSIFPKNEEKYNLSICAIFKNEAPYLKEWIEYHRLFGVDHFYLYNTGSYDYFLDILTSYIQQEIITLINWPEMIEKDDDTYAYKWALTTQIPAYENAVNFRARGETKWLVFVDTDEYLVCPVGNNITDLLKKYEDYPGISLSSDCFDAAMYHVFSPKKLIIQTLDLTKSPTQIVDKTVIKMIFKPDLCIGFIWPPYQCRFNNYETSVLVDRRELRINHYINRDIQYPPFTFSKDRLYVDNRFLSEDEIELLLDEGYVIEDQDRPIYQYIPQLLKNMGYKENKFLKRMGQKSDSVIGFR